MKGSLKRLSILQFVYTIIHCNPIFWATQPAVATAQGHLASSLSAPNVAEKARSTRRPSPQIGQHVSWLPHSKAWKSIEIHRNPWKSIEISQKISQEMDFGQWAKTPSSAFHRQSRRIPCAVQNFGGWKRRKVQKAQPMWQTKQSYDQKNLEVVTPTSSQGRATIVLRINPRPPRPLHQAILWAAISAEGVCIITLLPWREQLWQKPASASPNKVQPAKSWNLKVQQDLPESSESRNPPGSPKGRALLLLSGSADTISICWSTDLRFIQSLSKKRRDDEWAKGNESFVQVSLNTFYIPFI